MVILKNTGIIASQLIDVISMIVHCHSCVVCHSLEQIRQESAVQNKQTISLLGEGTAHLGEGKASTWIMDDTDDDDGTGSAAKKGENAVSNEDGSSEEENTVSLVSL